MIHKNDLIAESVVINDFDTCVDIEADVELLQLKITAFQRSGTTMQSSMIFDCATKKDILNLSNAFKKLASKWDAAHGGMLARQEMAKPAKKVKKAS